VHVTSVKLNYDHSTTERLMQSYFSHIKKLKLRHHLLAQDQHPSLGLPVAAKNYSLNRSL
jgi:hypothetical protein